MNLTRNLLHQLADSHLSEVEQTELRCRIASELEEAGNYEAACAALGEIWHRASEQPFRQALPEDARADVLLRVGSLTGWIGGAKQIEGAQETAKNLISESMRMFQASGKRNKVAQAQSDLAICYWREGAFDEARVLLQEALLQVDEIDGELRAVALLRKAFVERAAKRFNDALRIYSEAASIFDESTNHLLKGKFHNGLANVLNQLGADERRKDYIDQALIEYAAASFHFEQAGHARYEGCVENNLGFLLSTVGRFAEAHEHLDRAQMLYTSLKDDHVAQIDETRARVMLAEGRFVEAEKTVCAAVRTLEQGDERSLLAEALTTHGIAQARLKHPEQARLTFEHAIEGAERAGDLESAGNAAMVMIEELQNFLSNDDLKATVDRARDLLANTQELSTLKRLAACAARVLSLVHDRPGLPRSVDWKGFSFKGAVLHYEAHFIRLALDAADGVVTRAARLLGFNHHQSLPALLNGRHKELRNRGTPIIPRRRSIIQRRDGGIKSTEDD